jgi:hypothetical protein
MNKQVELLRDPEHLKELAQICEKTKNQKPRGRPVKINQTPKLKKQDG